MAKFTKSNSNVTKYEPKYDADFINIGMFQTRRFKFPKGKP